MENWISEIMNDFGYFGILLLIAVENLFPPIPSEIILTFAGFMTTYTNLTITGVVIISTTGSLIGAIILYAIGRILDVDRLGAIIEKYGRILRLTKEDIHKANAWFTKYGIWAVFFGRLIPLIRSLISIPAGSTHMNFATFILLTTVGSLIWNTALVYIGSVVGNSWGSIVEYMDIYSNIVYAGIVIAVVLFAIFFIRRRFFQKK